MYIQPEVKSSYEQNNLGRTIYEQIRFLKPQKVIDFGVLDGYSTIVIAQALKENGFGKVYAYDLFDDYEYNHAKRQTLEKNLNEYGVREWVEIEKVNFFDWLKTDEDFSCLHLDISNDGDIIDVLWDKFGNTDKTIIFEGGSEQRDRVGWMVKYNKKPINSSRAKFVVLNERFPSISKFICEN